jgi:hypothetical protein
MKEKTTSKSHTCRSTNPSWKFYPHQPEKKWQYASRLLKMSSLKEGTTSMSAEGQNKLTTTYVHY